MPSSAVSSSSIHAADPAKAKAVEHFKATLRAAVDAVRRGEHLTLDDALRARGLEPVKVDIRTGADIEGASLHEDMGGDAVVAPNLRQTRN